MPVSEYSKELFNTACERTIQKEHSQNGIGTLKEKPFMPFLKTFMNLIFHAMK